MTARCCKWWFPITVLLQVSVVTDIVKAHCHEKFCDLQRTAEFYGGYALDFTHNTFFGSPGGFTSMTCQVTCDNGGATSIYLKLKDDEQSPVATPTNYDAATVGGACTGDKTTTVTANVAAGVNPKKAYSYYITVNDYFTNVFVDCSCTPIEVDEDFCEPQSSFCFSAEATVQVLLPDDKQEATTTTTTTKSMKELQIGDKVLTKRHHHSSLADIYQTVYAFGHYSPNYSAEFLLLYTSKMIRDLYDNHRNNITGMDHMGSTEDPLQMTRNHLVSCLRHDDNNGEPTFVRADSIQVGDVLLDEFHRPTLRVTRIDKETKQGLYMPLTRGDGTLVVNGILASSYVSLQEEAPTAVQTSSSLYFWMTNNNDHERLVLHWWLAPMRLFCGRGEEAAAFGLSSTSSLSIIQKFCRANANNDEQKVGGIHPWLQYGLNWMQWADQQSTIVQYAIGVPLWGVFGLLTLAEYGMTRIFDINALSIGTVVQQ